MSDTHLLTLAELRAVDVELDGLVGLGHPASALRAGVVSPELVAVAGLDGYLFIGNGANAWERQLLGELTIPAGWFSGWTACFAARQAEAARRSVVLENLVVPEKQILYADKRWATPVAVDRRPMAQLRDHLTPDLRVRYPLLELKASRLLGSAYHRHDSHWTGSGCCAVAGALAGVLDLNLDWQELRFAYRRKVDAADLTSHFLSPAPPEEVGQLVPVTAPYFETPATIPGRHAGSSYGVRNPDALDPRRVVVFGDSYAHEAGLAAALSAIFAQVVFKWSKDVEWSVVDEHGADIVIWESAERYLATISKA